MGTIIPESETKACKDVPSDNSDMVLRSTGLQGKGSSTRARFGVPPKPIKKD